MTRPTPAPVEQLSLGLTSRHADLHPYWRAQLKQWVHNALYYRHARGTTGWSMATDGYDFARWLFRDGQLSRGELKRYFRFNLRIQRMEKAWRAAA